MRSFTIVDSVRPSDVVLGRGRHLIHHHGNKRMRAIVKRKKLDYFHASKSERSTMIKEMVETVLNCEEGEVRFLKQAQGHPKNTFRLLFDDEIHAKISHNLREGMPKSKKLSSSRPELKNIHSIPQSTQAKKKAASIGKQQKTLKSAALSDEMVETDRSYPELYDSPNVGEPSFEVFPSFPTVVLPSNELDKLSDEDFQLFNDLAADHTDADMEYDFDAESDRLWCETLDGGSVVAVPNDDLEPIPLDREPEDYPTVMVDVLQKLFDEEQQ